MHTINPPSYSVPAGRIEALFIAPEAGAPMQRVESVQALEDVGLEGDRYANGLGAFSRWPGARRQVTLISAEAMADVHHQFGLDLSEGQHRRNVVVSGVDLPALVKLQFQVGEAVFEGVQVCAPCKYLVRVTGEPRIFDALVGRGGLRARIVRGGWLRQGAGVSRLDP